MLSSRQGRLLQETAPRGWRVTGGKELEAQGLGRGRGTGGKGAWPPEPLWPSEPQAARPSWAPGAGPCSRGGARRMKRPPWVAREVARCGHLVALTGSLWRGPAGAGRRGRGSRGLDRSRALRGTRGKGRAGAGSAGRGSGGCSGARGHPRARRPAPEPPAGHKDWTQGRSLSLAPETMNCHLNRRLSRPTPRPHPVTPAQRPLAAPRPWAGVDGGGPAPAPGASPIAT